MKASKEQGKTQHKVENIIHKKHPKTTKGHAYKRGLKSLFIENMRRGRG